MRRSLLSSRCDVTKQAGAGTRQSPSRRRHGAPRRALAVLVGCVALFAVAIDSAHSFYHWPIAVQLSHGTPISLIAASLIYFFLHTAGIAAAIALTDRVSGPGNPDVQAAPS